MLRLAEINDEIRNISTVKVTGHVTGIKGPIIQARVPTASLKDICQISCKGRLVPAQIVSFDGEIVSLAPFGTVDGIAPGAEVRSTGRAPMVKIFDDMLGAVVDAMGEVLSDPKSTDALISKDAGALSGRRTAMNIFADPPNPLSRKKISSQLFTGIKSIDGLIPIGYGQRIGLFAGAGVGKSTLLGMISRNAQVDVSVIALVGERGREVNEFLEDSLGDEGRKKSVVVVATSDEAPLRRMLAPFTATAIAEYYRSLGKNVLLLVDSITRTARAIREVGLSIGELPVRQGYTPSVFTELPRLLERAGTDSKGSITAVYTVLTNGDDELDPLGEEIKSILDGHIYLTNRMIQQGVRPAIDPTISVSRVMNQITSEKQIERISLVTRMLSRLKKDKDILLLGGTPDKDLERCLQLEQGLLQFLHQKPHETISIDEINRFLWSANFNPCSV